MATPPHLISFLFFICLLSQQQQPVSSTDFVFNGFTATSSNLTLYGSATLDNILTLTTVSVRLTGRAYFRSPIPFPPTTPISFYTSFIFSIASLPGSLTGDAIVFHFTPISTLLGASSARHLSVFNCTNEHYNYVYSNVPAMAFDNCVTSIRSHTAGYWVDDHHFRQLELNNGANYQAWIDYSHSLLSITVAPAGMTRPTKPLLSVSLNLSDVFLDEMYVGFTAAASSMIEAHRILAWSFSNSDKMIGDRLITSNLPSFVPPKSSVFRSKRFIIGISLGVFVLICSAGLIWILLVKRRRKLKTDIEEQEDWEMEYWPHRIPYQDIHKATNGFSDENVVGSGVNGKVYKGLMDGGFNVAVKLISNEREEDVRGFLAEVSSLGRLRHRNLVGFRGWCKRDCGSLILVYDLMDNGSLDKRVFECDESVLLSWEDRVRVLQDVAEGVSYLHEGWEAKVLHRDIKASNVLLDKDMRGRLGDFGLARIYDHAQAAGTTLVVGTAGYMAPEVIRTGRASAQTDVFGFGVLVLEVICGRRPIDDGKPPLVGWVWDLMEKGILANAVDKRLLAKGGGIDKEEAERLLHLGLLCAYPDPRTRPTMRQVVKLLDREDSDGEEMDKYLLDKGKTSAMWSKYRRSLRNGGHPIFDQIQQSISSSLSLLESDILVEGR